MCESTLHVRWPRMRRVLQSCCQIIRLLDHHVRIVIAAWEEAEAVVLFDFYGMSNIIHTNWGNLQ